MNSKRLKIAGVIPAAGRASRISPIPCSKEIFPIGFQNGKNPPEIKVAVAHLLESFSEAGADQVYMVIRKGKWDIPQYLGVGTQPEYTLAYIVTEPTPGTHYSINLAYPFVKDRMVLLGFPDIQFQPQNAFTTLLNKQEKTGADVVLGLFKTSQPHKADMVDSDKEGRVKAILVKPGETKLKYCWAIAVWTPFFTEYLHKFVAEIAADELDDRMQEVYIGNVLQEAMKDGLIVESVSFEDGNFIDIGTLSDLKKVWRKS